MAEETNKYHWILMILGLFINMPIWLYLLYKILQAIEASELTWFLFIIYIPVQITTMIIARLADMK